MNENLIKAAIEWGEAGIPVFPCNDKKRPVTKNGFKDAETDPQKIRTLFEFFPNATMIGGAMGNGLFAVDVDLYKGDEVVQWYRDRIDEGALPPTRMHTTKSGGAHLFYESDTAPTCVPAKGVDVKGDGGYVILPPSDGYTEVSKGVVRAPKMLMELIGRSGSVSSKTVSGLEHNVLSGNDFHNSLTQLAAKLGARGSSQLEIQDHLIRLLETSVAKNPRHARHSRWSKIMADEGGELTKIVSSGYVKFNDDAVISEAEELLGSTQPVSLDGIFTPVPNFEPPKVTVYAEDADPFAGEGYSTYQQHNLEDVKYTMYPIYTENETVVLYAEPKMGKTAFALTSALHIAYGLDMGSLKVTGKGSCLYYALEGSHAIRLRKAAWHKEMNRRGIVLDGDTSGEVFVVEKYTNFGKENVREESAAKIIQAHKRYARMGKPLKAIFIDTLTKAMSGSDQNSVEDTSSLFEIVSLCRAGGVTATIIFVHHKARQGNVRGSSNIEAEPDMLLDVTKKGDVISMNVARARSIEDGQTFHFGIKGIDLGTTTQGHKLSSMFVEAIGESDREHSDDDFVEVKREAERRRVITSLGSGCDASDVIEAWYKVGLIDGRKVSGKTVSPSSNSAAAQKALHEVAPDVGGAIFMDHIIRPIIGDNNKVTGFTVT